MKDGTLDGAEAHSPSGFEFNSSLELHRMKQDPSHRRLWSVVSTAAVLLSLLLQTSSIAMASGPQWVPVEDQSLSVTPGSALDFSNLVPSAPAGSLGKTFVRSDGHLAFSARPKDRARFNCAPLTPWWSPDGAPVPDHATADAYADQLRLHGYNIVRFHFVDRMLMQKRKQDFDFDPVMMDRFQYLMNALKKRGIYWILEAMAYKDGAIADTPAPVPYPSLKLAVHFDPEARQEWKELFQSILTRRNPYTGTRPIDDPALVTLILANENSVNFLTRQHVRKGKSLYPPVMITAFNNWLQTEYKTGKALAKAWGGLNNGESLKKKTIELPAAADGSARMRDFQRFVIESELETTAFMEQVVREAGYKGPLTNYNTGWSFGDALSRSNLPVIDLHTYSHEAANLKPGSVDQQTSSLDNAAYYIQGTSSARYLNRPMMVLEFGQPFWNKYRHEMGVTMPAYAALQDWDTICVHGSGPVAFSFAPTKHRPSINAFDIAIDPVARAGQTLNTLLFYRGDVSPSPHKVGITFDEKVALANNNAQDNLPNDITSLSLLTGLGIAIPADKSNADVTIQTSSDKTAESWIMRGILHQIDKALGQSTDRLEQNVTRLKKAGIISAHNQTNVQQGLFESDTGQILMDVNQRQFKVITPRTEAISLDTITAPVRLDKLTVLRASAPVLIAVSALDNLPVSTSQKLLVIVASDAINTGMTFEDEDRTTLKSLGRLPPQILKTQVELRLKRPDTDNFELHSLQLNGDLGDRLPIASDRQGLTLQIDNSQSSHGPTTYFLLTKSNNSDLHKHKD